MNRPRRGILHRQILRRLRRRWQRGSSTVLRRKHQRRIHLRVNVVRLRSRQRRSLRPTRERSSRAARTRTRTQSPTTCSRSRLLTPANAHFLGQLRVRHIRRVLRLRQHPRRRRRAPALQWHLSINFVDLPGAKHRLLGRPDLINPVAHQFRHDRRRSISLQRSHAGIAMRIGADRVMKFSRAANKMRKSGVSTVSADAFSV